MIIGSYVWIRRSLDECVADHVRRYEEAWSQIVRLIFADLTFISVLVIVTRTRASNISWHSTLFSFVT